MRGLRALKLCFFLLHAHCSYRQIHKPQAFTETFTLVVIETRRTLEDYGFEMREMGNGHSVVIFLPIKVLFVLKSKLYSIHTCLDIQ